MLPYEVNLYETNDWHEWFGPYYKCPRCRCQFYIESEVVKLNFCPHCGIRLHASLPNSQCDWPKEEQARALAERD